MECDDCGEFDCDCADGLAEGITDETPRTRARVVGGHADERTIRSRVRMAAELDWPRRCTGIAGARRLARHRFGPGARFAVVAPLACIAGYECRGHPARWFGERDHSRPVHQLWL